MNTKLPLKNTRSITPIAVDVIDTHVTLYCKIIIAGNLECKQYAGGSLQYMVYYSKATTVYININV